MGWWTEHAVPRITDRALATADVAALREATCRGLSGRVLEIGFGSGLNLRHLPADVTSVSAVEPSAVGWALSERRRRGAAVPVTRTGLDGQRLAEADETFDAVLSTFTLCTIPDVARALAEVRRVLRSGGRFHFLEHGLSPDAGVARWQARLEPLQKRVFAGCHLTRDIPALVAGAGLLVEELTASYLPGPAVVRPFCYEFVGTATRT